MPVLVLVLAECPLFFIFLSLPGLKGARALRVPLVNDDARVILINLERPVLLQGYDARSVNVSTIEGRCLTKCNLQHVAGAPQLIGYFNS